MLPGSLVHNEGNSLAIALDPILMLRPKFREALFYFFFCERSLNQDVTMDNRIKKGATDEKILQSLKNVFSL